MGDSKRRHTGHLKAQARAKEVCEDDTMRTAASLDTEHMRPHVSPADSCRVPKQRFREAPPPAFLKLL